MEGKNVGPRLGVSAEYLSRCENGQKNSSVTTEKLFRLYVLLQTPDKSALTDLNLSEVFKIIEVNPVWDPSQELVFHFVRRPIVDEPVTEFGREMEKGAVGSCLISLSFKKWPV